MHLAEKESPQRKSECIQLMDVEREGRDEGDAEREDAGGRREAKKRSPFTPLRAARRRREGAEV